MIYSNGQTKNILKRKHRNPFGGCGISFALITGGGILLKDEARREGEVKEGKRTCGGEEVVEPCGTRLGW